MLPATAIAALVLATGADVDFQREIAPLFAARCVECHGPEKQRSGYRLDVRESALFRGDSSAPNIVPGDAANSPLVRYVSGVDPSEVMPPRGERLSAEEVALVARWIDEGAPWPDEASAVVDDPLAWWSLAPLLLPPTPEGDTHPIDGFVRARLADEGLAPAPEADARTLCRRLHFDLLGLPPTPEELDAYVADEDPTKFERLVERLLASPRYGERWARHWLDVVHYADTHGFDKDKPREHAWPYRDYVIRALNEDKPYARFVQEQLAGDALFPGTQDGVEALGFIAAGPWDLIGHEEVSEDKVDGKFARHFDRDDMVGNALGAFASTTVQCAQCHDHKFDPIPQEDYYALQAVFAALDRADRRYDPDPAVAAKRAALGAEAARIQDERRALGEAPGAEADALRAELDAALARTEAALADLPAPHLVYAGTVHSGSGAFVGTGATGGRPREVRVLARGQVTQPGEVAAPGALSMLDRLLPSRFALPPDAPESARRAALATWLTDPRNPLLWRSIVNRVWQHHFGRGLVDTPNDFGRMGAMPSHPELLDWLAVSFRDDMRGSLKALHRTLVTSATYRQRSDVADPRAEALDRDNALLWRANPRKLEAEAVRDAMLATSGALDLAMGGPGYRDFVLEQPEHSPHYRYDLADPADPATHRRSVYRFVVRSQMQPFMTALDCADPSQRVDKRNQSVSPNQALAYLNNGLVLAAAARFAERVRREAEGAVEAQVARAVRLALGRAPRADELERLAAYTRAHGLENTCRVLFNLNEFTFVD